MAKLSRRELLAAMALAGGAALRNGLPCGRLVSRPETAALGAADFKVLTDLALGRARALGCAWAAVGIKRERNGSIRRRVASGRKGAGFGRAEVETERLTLNVRVVHSGRWGHAEGSALSSDDVVRTTVRAVAIARAAVALGDRPATRVPDALKPDRWITPHDRFDRPLDDRLASLAATNPAAVTFVAREDYYVSSKGAFGHSTQLNVA